MIYSSKTDISAQKKILWLDKKSSEEYCESYKLNGKVMKNYDIREIVPALFQSARLILSLYRKGDLRGVETHFETLTYELKVLNHKLEIHF